MYLSLLSIAIGIAALAVLVRWIEPRIAFFPLAGESETPRDHGIPFEAVTIETSDGEHLRGWVMQPPAPRARIVYFHGNGANLSNWSPILAGIVRRGYSVFAFDYRGYGMSTGRASERGLYRDVDAVVKTAWPDADASLPTVYWGRSLGATMAAYGATVRPPDGVVVESGFTNARAAVRGSTPLVLLSFLSSYRFPTAELLNQAHRPVLVMHGDRDGVIPFELGKELFDRIAAEKRFFVIDQGDHNDAVPPRPEAYWAAVDAFIATLVSRIAGEA